MRVGSPTERAAAANPELTMDEYASIVTRISGAETAGRTRLAGLIEAGLFAP